MTLSLAVFYYTMQTVCRLLIEIKTENLKSEIYLNFNHLPCNFQFLFESFNQTHINYDYLK